MGLPEFYSVLVAPIFPIPDLAPAAFAGVLYLGIFRYDYLGGQGVLLNFGIKVIYYFFLTLTLTFGIWIYQHLFLESPFSGWLLTAIGALLIVILTPMVTNLNHSLQEKVFPVKATFIRANQMLIEALRDANSSEDCLNILQSVLQNELGYKQLQLVQDPRYSHYRKFKVFGLREILSRVRFLQNDENGLSHWRGMYKLLRRFKSDLVVQVCTEQRWYGIFFIKESQWGLEHWNTINPLLESLAQRTADHSFLLDMVESHHRQQQIAEMGIMAAQLAHEIKNPLQGIHGATQLLIEEYPESPFLNIVKEDTLRLNQIVQNFLEFARPYNIKLQEVEILDFIKHWMIKKNFSEAAITYSSHSTQGQIYLSTDTEALEQILDNLLQNATRHGAAEKKSELCIQQFETHIEIKLRDFGKGVAPAHRSKLFRPFFSTHSQGNGLGLAYCVKLAKALQGELNYTPCDPGSEFSVRLPKAL